jgi:type II secretory pathway pseudopilin PulG
MKITQKNAGFTLIEIMVIMIIFSMMLVGFGNSFAKKVNQSKRDETKIKLDFIKESLDDYLKSHGHYPCPAAFDPPLDTANFAREADIDCDQNGAGVTFRVAGRAGAQVRIGAIPTRNLNIDDDYGFDGWNNRFTYAVTESLAQQVSYDDNAGAIDVINLDGTSILSTPQTAHLVILSHGADGQGAYTTAGVQSGACPNSADELDRDNCAHDNAIFTQSIIQSGSNAQKYDDFLLSMIAGATSDRFPSAAVVPFAIPCPAGWNLYTGHDMAGRAIVGQGIYNETAVAGTAIDPTSLVLENWTYTHTYDFGDSGGFVKYRIDENELPTLNNFYFEDQSTASPPIALTAAEVAVGFLPSTITTGFHYENELGGNPVSLTNVMRYTPAPPTAALIDNRMPYVALNYCIQS